MRDKYVPLVSLEEALVIRRHMQIGNLSVIHKQPTRLGVTNVNAEETCDSQGTCACVNRVGSTGKQMQ